jgi:hypothetical protein
VLWNECADGINESEHHRVSDIHVIPTEFVRKQIDDVVADIPPKCIKTGKPQLRSNDVRYARECRNDTCSC